MNLSNDTSYNFKSLWIKYFLAQSHCTSYKKAKHFHAQKLQKIVIQSFEFKLQHHHNKAFMCPLESFSSELMQWKN